MESNENLGEADTSECTWLDPDLELLTVTGNDLAADHFVQSGDIPSHGFLEYEEMCHSTQSSPTGNLPSMEEFPGPYNFKVKLNPSGRSSWVYSSILDQVFIDSGKVLMIQFHLSSVLPGMSVRALPVYSSPDFISLPVSRCPVHALEDDPNSQAHQQEGECLCLDYRLAGHVVRVYTIDAKYCYDKFSERHSVLVPLATPQPGSDFTEVPYLFTCNTSCSGGMKRRPIHIIFTLENRNGEVVGRSLMAVKICSCPKRDKERMEREKNAIPLTAQEESSSNSRRLMPQPIGPHKRVKFELIDKDDEKKTKIKLLVDEIRKTIAYAFQKIEELESLCD